MKELELDENNDIADEGYSSFTTTLCDTSSINNTFLSNHTLESLSSSGSQLEDLPYNLVYSLALNASSGDKKEVAMKKIMTYHQHFDMEPFFEWDLKVLPLVIDWFERVRSIKNAGKGQSKRNRRIARNKSINKLKLGVIYQFVRAMPDVFGAVPAVGGGKQAHLKKSA